MLRQDGAAVVESLFAIVFMMALALGAIQVAHALYARNVVISSAHEAARAAVERGRSSEEARAIALRVMRGAAGGVIEAPEVAVLRRASGTSVLVAVEVRGRIRSLGPFPELLPVRVRAAATGEFEVP